MISVAKHLGDTNVMGCLRDSYNESKGTSRNDLSQNKMIKIKWNEKFQMLSCQIFWQTQSMPMKLISGLPYGNSCWEFSENCQLFALRKPIY